MTTFPGAIAELAARHGRGFCEVSDLIQLTHQRSGLGFSVEERAVVIGEVARTLGYGQSEVSGEQIVSLSAWGAGEVAALAGDEYGGGDDGEGDPEAVELAGSLTQEGKARRARSGPGGDAQNVIDRHPEFRHLFKGGRTSSRRHPAKSGKPLGSKDRAHTGDLEDSPTDRDQPARGGSVHGEVARYLKMREQEFGGEAGHAGSHGSDSHGPRKG